MSNPVGFPTHWSLGDPPLVEIVRTWSVAPLHAILGITGMSIHHLINSRWVKEIVVQLFKARREVKRGEEERWQEEAAKYWAWVRFYVGEVV